MLPEAQHDNLLYVSVQTTCCTGSGADLYVFSFPAGKLVGELNVTTDTMFGLCSNANGDVFVTAFDTSDSFASSYIYEYAHGGTSPIAKYYDPWESDACSVDPTTGNLAVANWYTNGQSRNANILVYNLTSGKYTQYYDPDVYYYKWCAYDTKGNLYVDSAGFSDHTPLAVLPKGQSSFTNLSLNSDVITDSLQWYHGDLVVAGYERSIGPEALLKVHLNGTKGRVERTIALKDYGHEYGSDSQFVIWNGHVISGGYPGYNLHEWLFPEGGFPRRRIARSQGGWWYGVAISR
jgi:hypothetical protein